MKGQQLLSKLHWTQLVEQDDPPHKTCIVMHETAGWSGIGASPWLIDVFLKQPKCRNANETKDTVLCDLIPKDCNTPM